jgi:putative MATE family efflux protein
MAPKTHDMTVGKPMSLLIRFALPLMAGNVFQQLYTVVDTMIVGKALGVGALAALGAADWLNWLMLGMMQGLTQGFAILMAQAFGARQYDDLKKTVGNSLVLCGVCSVVLILVGQIFLGPVLKIMQTPSEVRGDSALYLRIMFGGIPVVMAYNLFASILRSVGDSKTPLYAMIIACAVNVGLDLLFVLVFHWGIAGAAAATLLAQCCSALYCLWQLKKIETVTVSQEHLKPDYRLSCKLMKLGSAMAFQYMIIAVGGLVVQFVVNGEGVMFIAGITATNKLYGVLEIAATSFGFAMATFVGQNLGAGRFDRIRRGQLTGYILALITSGIIAALMVLLGKPILSCFISGTAEEVAQTMQISFRYLMVMSAFLPALYALYVAKSSLQGLGNTFLPLMSGVVELAARTAVVFTLPLLIGTEGIFFAEVSAWVGADLVLLPGYFLTVRKIEKLHKQC